LEDIAGREIGRRTPRPGDGRRVGLTEGDQLAGDVVGCGVVPETGGRGADIALEGSLAVSDDPTGPDQCGGQPLVGPIGEHGAGEEGGSDGRRSQGNCYAKGRYDH
jgi:hypothetical protein